MIIFSNTIFQEILEIKLKINIRIVFIDKTSLLWLLVALQIFSCRKTLNFRILSIFLRPICI